MDTGNKVFVAKTGDVTEVNFVGGMTLGEALKQAGYKNDGVTDIRVNNKQVTDMDFRLNVNDQVTLLGKIAGA